MMQITAAQVLNALQRHIGKGNGIHVRDLVRQVTGQTTDTEHLERKVREVITELRMGGQHVCGHPSSGYFIAADAEELTATCNFLYSRSMTGLQQVAAMKRVSMPDLRGQFHLPT
jgi:hypothetical protein